MILQAGTAFWCSWPLSFDGGGAEMEVTDENKAQHREGSGEGSVENPRLLTVAPLLLTGNQWNTTRCFEFEVLIKIRLVLRGFPWSFYSTWSQMHLWGWYREAFNTSTSKFFSSCLCENLAHSYEFTQNLQNKQNLMKLYIYPEDAGWCRYMPPFHPEFKLKMRVTSLCLVAIYDSTWIMQYASWVCLKLRDPTKSHAKRNSFE